jgi:hypothetical protein
VQTDITARYVAWRGKLARGLDQRLYTIEHLDWMVAHGLGVPIFGERSIIVVEIKGYPTGARAVCGVVAAGDEREIENVLIPEAEEWGKAHGCTLGMIESRPGWARVMKKHGYRVSQVCIVKEF